MRRTVSRGMWAHRSSWDQRRRGRETSGSLDPHDAQALLRYTSRHHDPLAVVEFGNEPNLYVLNSGFPGTYGAADYVADLRRFDQYAARRYRGSV